MCDPDFYQVISGQLNRLDPTVQPAQYTDEQSNNLGSYNATGFNIQDSYIYGLLSNENLVRIGSDGVAFDLGPVTGLPPLNNATYFVGDFDLNGNYFVIRGNNLYKIDVVTQTAVQVNLTGQANGIADFAYYDPDMDASNGFSFVGTRGGGDFLVKIDLNAAGTSGTATRTLPLNGIGNPNINNESGGFGAAFTVNVGQELYFTNNSSGRFYRVNIDESGASPVAYGVFISTAQPTNNNDGASCANAPSPFPCTVNILLLEQVCTNSSEYDVIATIATVNPSSPTFTVDINNGAFMQTFNYADLPDPPNNQVTISGVDVQGTDIEVRIYDNIDDVDCAGSDTYDSPDCCQANAGILRADCSLVCNDNGGNSPADSDIAIEVDLSTDTPPAGYEYVFFLLLDSVIQQVIPAVNYDPSNPMSFTDSINIGNLPADTFQIVGYSYNPSDAEFTAIPTVSTNINSFLANIDEIDNQANFGDLCADIALDNGITFEILNTQSYVVDAGTGVEVCSARKLRLATLNATLNASFNARWSTDGDGMFLAADGLTVNDLFDEAVFYMLGPNDRENLTFELTLSVDICTLTPCTLIDDTVEINVKQVGCGTFPWNGND